MDKQGQQLDPMQQKALAVLTGEVPPPNEMIAYLVTRATAARDGAREATEKAKQLHEQLQQQQVLLAEFRGASRSYAEDVQKLLTQLEAEKEALDNAE